MDRRYICIVALFFLVTACKEKSQPGAAVEAELKNENEINYVSTSVLKSTDFYHELVSNGKLIARRKVDLRFQSSEPIEKIYVKNGDFVKKGDRLAELNTVKLQAQIKGAEISLLKAEIGLQDGLLGQGYHWIDSAQIPERTMRVIGNKSGYDAALLQLAQAKLDLAQATLRAPFNGVVANLFDKELNYPSNTVFCTLIDNSEMEIDFSILENELGLVKRGDSVTVKPLVVDHEELKGKITEINPLVETNGLVSLRAVVPNHSGRLYEGMNVRIAIQRSIPNKWVVPKQAILLKNGKQMMFTKKNGRAIWNYVETGLENSSSYTVTGKDLQEGDSVIVEGNINLAHNVLIMEDER